MLDLRGFAATFVAACVVLATPGCGSVVDSDPDGGGTGTGDAEAGAGAAGSAATGASFAVASLLTGGMSPAGSRSDTWLSAQAG